MKTLTRSLLFWIVTFALAACLSRNANPKTQTATSPIDTSLAAKDTQRIPPQALPDDSTYCKIYCWCLQKINMQDGENELHSFCETFVAASPASIAREENLHVKFYAADSVASLYKLLSSATSSTPYQGKNYPDSRLVIVLKRKNLAADTFVYTSRNTMFIVPRKMLQYDFNIGDALEKAIGQPLRCEDGH